MKGMKVNLPTGISGETQTKKEYISVSVDMDGNAYFDKTKMSYDDLTKTLTQVHSTNPDAKVFVRGDRDTMHGNIIHVLDILRATGFYKIAFEIKSEALKGVPPAPGS
jgi:biopolymer transport protein ExbD